MLRGFRIAAALCLLLTFTGGAMRYLLSNVYGDAADLHETRPGDVTVVPFGWDAATEATRNALLRDLGTSVSALPALLYAYNGGYSELRVHDQGKPWTWTKANEGMARGFAVAFLGDSITANKAAAQGQLPAPFSVADLRGVSGNTAAQVAARRGQVAAGTTRIIIQAGTNDLLGLDDETGIIPAYTTMLDYFRDNFPNARVLVIGIPPIDEAAIRQDWRPYLAHTRTTRVNASIANLCAQYANCTTVMGGLDFTGKTTDGIHLTTAGYQTLAAAVMPKL
jgi:lysophospholipase L1-like esterase